MTGLQALGERDEGGTMPFGRHRVLATSDFEEANAAMRKVFPGTRMHPPEDCGPTWRVDMTLHALKVGETKATCIRFDNGVRVRSDRFVDYLVNIPLSGAAEVREGALEPVVATPEQAVVLTPDTSAEAVWGGRCTQVCLAFACRTVHRELEALLDQPVVRPIEFAPAIDLTTADGRTWTAALQLLERHSHNRFGVLDNQLASANLEKMLIDHLLLTQPHSYAAALARPVPQNLPGPVRQAIELLRSHPEKPWTTATLARAVAVSGRSLQEGFRHSAGVPPMRYLRDVRLERVHADLLEAAQDATTVSQIAHRWGFLYLGRFSASYREKFGESPSETLRRHR